MTKTNQAIRATAAAQRAPKATVPGATIPPSPGNSSNDKPKEPPKATDTGSLPTQKQPSKQQHLASMVLRDEGATLDQMVAALDWLPHTTRAALTGLKKKGFAISSDKIDGIRTYRAVAPE